jgi:signal transduction histidine kinase
VLTTLLVGPIAGYFLVGYTSSQFSRMLTSKAQALEAANRDLKVTGNELRLHQVHLEELVRRRTEDLGRAYEELRHANRELLHLNELKSGFLANVSHELRTPLTSIRSFSEILLNYPDEDPNTRTEFLGIIKSESERLTRLINDVLDLAKIEAGRIEWRMQPVRLESIVHMSLEIMRGWAERKGLNAEITLQDDLPLILGDPDRLIQVTTNLLNNAMKFTTQGYVQVGTQRRGDEVLLFVIDSGPGIPPEERELVFEKFHQCGNTLTEKPKGTGLGLSICREIVQYHSGRIWVESVMGEGSTFYCSFPVLEEPQTGMLVQSSAAHPGR